MPIMRRACCIYPLQVGVVLVATFLLVTSYVLTLTLLDGYGELLQAGLEFAHSLVVVGVFVVLLLVVGVTLIAGAYLKSRVLITIAFVLFVGTIIYWVTYVTLSFTVESSKLQNVCLGLRCAGSLWMVPLRLRYPPSCINGPPTTTDQIPMVRRPSTKQSEFVTTTNPNIIETPAHTIFSTSKKMPTTKERITSYSTTKKVISTTDSEFFRRGIKIDTENPIIREKKEEKNLFITENINKMAFVITFYSCIFFYCAIIVLCYTIELWTKEECEEEEEIELRSLRRKRKAN